MGIRVFDYVFFLQYTLSLDSSGTSFDSPFVVAVVLVVVMECVCVYVCMYADSISRWKTIPPPPSQVPLRYRKVHTRGHSLSTTIFGSEKLMRSVERDGRYLTSIDSAMSSLQS